MYSNLDRGNLTPDQVGSLYDLARDWERRTSDDLNRWHNKMANEFRWGGNILSPQLDGIQPTDAATLTIYVRRRGQVLRNILDGTPGKNLRGEA